MLQRLRLLFLPWSESTATPGKVLLSCTSLLQSPLALLLLMFGMTLKPDPKRPVEIQRRGGSERERDWDRRKEKGVFKKQEIEVYQKSSSEQQTVFTILLQPRSFSPCPPLPSFYPATFLLWLQARPVWAYILAQVCYLGQFT